MNSLPSFLTAVSVSCFVYALLSYFLGLANFEEDRIQTRLDRLITRRPADYKIARNMQFSNIAMLNELFKKQQMYQKVYELLLLSGWNMPLNLFFFLDLLWAGAVFLAAHLITHSAPAAFVLGIVTAGFPYLVLLVNRRRYIREFTLHFPDALLMMKNAIRAGQSVHAAFEIVAEEGPKPVCTEFARMIQEIELGSHMNEALNSVYRRIQTIDFRLFVLGIFIQQEVGGNLTEIFEHIEKTIRDRMALLREIKAITAQGRISGTILMILPLAVAFVIRLINPHYFDPLLEEEVGRRILWGVLGLQLLGALVIRRMTSFSLIE